MHSLQHILVGTDFSSGSEAAIDAAVRIAQRGDMRVTLVHVAAPTGTGLDDHVITPHALYNALGARTSERLVAYQALFAVQLSERDLLAIRQATAKRGVIRVPRIRGGAAPKAPVVRGPGTTTDNGQIDAIRSRKKGI